MPVILYPKKGEGDSMESMKVKITKQTVAGQKTVRPGEEIEVPKHEGRMLVSMGKAQPCDEKDLGPGKEDINDESKIPPPIEEINPKGEPPSRVIVDDTVDEKAAKESAKKKEAAAKYAEKAKGAVQQPEAKKE